MVIDLNSARSLCMACQLLYDASRQLDELCLGDQIDQPGRKIGVSILLIEQNARAALDLASFGYVMEVGTIVLSGPASTLAGNPRVVESYLGSTGDAKNVD